jgi:uncharacterized membrane protein
MGAGMRTIVIAYLATAVVFFAMDFVWLSAAVSTIYKPRLGGLLLDTPNMPVAAGFYLLYVVGVLAFAVFPALAQGDWTRALWGGALLGLVSYGTYDMTNLATMVGWSALVSVVDMVWGTVVTGIAATAGYFIVRVL